LLNIGDETALGVRMAFAAPLRGMGGDVLISELPIFRRLAMLRPGGRIEVPIDVAHGFFARKESPVVRVRVRYHDRAGARHCEVFRHDLGAFEGLPELIDGVSGISGSADAAGGTRGD
jgi:CelD/BcsL family acetyltransferase involved in cellulose biosynthesis